MGEDIITVFDSKSGRLHQPPAGCRSIPGVHIHVLAPETLWTVVGVAVPFNGGATISTDEIFDITAKFFVHRFNRLSCSVFSGPVLESTASPTVSPASNNLRTGLIFHAGITVVSVFVGASIKTSVPSIPGSVRSASLCVLTNTWRCLLFCIREIKGAS